MTVAGVVISGHAIVSSDDRIADASGDMPAGLRNDADWRQFQTELDRAAIVVVGRIGHQDFANVRQRRRLVLSSSARGLEQRPDAWWWNPQATTWDVVANTLLPDGGRVAVTGGRRVFDLFLPIGFDAFHLACATQCRIPGGDPIFSACGAGASAGSVLAEHGLSMTGVEILDAAAGVRLDLWGRRR